MRYISVNQTPKTSNPGMGSRRMGGERCQAFGRGTAGQGKTLWLASQREFFYTHKYSMKNKYLYMAPRHRARLAVAGRFSRLQNGYNFLQEMTRA